MATGLGQEGFVDVAAVADVYDDEPYGVKVNGQRVVLCKVDGQLYAVGGLCSHQYAELDEGELRGCVLMCPLHNSGFDVRTGQAIQLPATQPIPTYTVRVENGRVLVSLRPVTPG
jgi:nitrite reductase/ring-hydroxylating ferredoxin subunit